MSAPLEDVRGKPDLSMIGLLLVEMIIGYEWLASGVVKLARGGFPSGLAGELLEKAEGVPEWYGNILERALIPNAVAFGYLIEISEILAGVALIVGPFIWLCAWDRVSDRVRAAVLVSTVAAAVGATFLAINLHLANGASHPWFLPESGFDEGIDLDSVLPAIQFVIAAIGIIQLKRLRQNRTDRLGAGAHSVVNIA